MSKQQPRTFDLSKYKTAPEVDSSDDGIRTFDLSNYSPKKKDDTALSGKISSTAGSSEQGGNPRQLFGMSYADWGKKYGAIGEFAADIVDVPIFFKNEIYKGVLNGAINDEIKRADGVGEKPDFDKIANLRKDINSVSLPKSTLDKIDESDDVVSKAVKSIGGTIVSSLASSIGAYKSGAVGAGTGALTGAAVGNVFAEVTAPVGAIAGYQAATSFANEYGSAVTDAMMANGYDISDPKQLEKAWNDKSVMDLAREKGTERGLTVAAIDLVTAGIASKFGGKAAVKYAESKFIKEAGKEFTEAAAGRIAATTTTAIEAAGGSIGEATAQLVSEGKISDWDAVGMEAFAEIGGGAPMTAYNYFKAAQINSTANKENSTKIQSLQTMLESLPENDETAPILQGKIAELKRDNDIRNNLVVETLDTAPVPVAKKVLELTNQIESFDQKLQEFDDASKVGSGLTDEQRQQQKTFKDIYTELTTERDNIVGELAKAKEFETNIKAPSPEQTMPSPIEVTKIQKAINSMTEFVGENLKAFAPTFAILPNGDYSLSIGKEGKPNPDSIVIFNKEERQQRRELDSMLDEGTVTPEEHTNKVAELNKQVISRGIQEKTSLITPKEKTEVTPAQVEAEPQTEEFVYETAPENKKQWKGDFEVVDNREGKAGLEVNGVDGRWYVKNNVTGKILPATTKNEALGLIDNAPENDFGQGETYTRPVTVAPAVEPTTVAEQPIAEKPIAPKGESVSTIGLIPLEVDEKGDIKTTGKTQIVESAKKALSTLKSVLPNFDIIIHQDEASYNEVMKEVNGKQNSGGNFSYTQNEDGSYSGKIDINLNKANSRTVAHEVAHGILLKTFGDNPAVFKDFKNKLSKILKGSTNKELIDFTNQYEGDVAYEEYITELTGILEQQQDNISPTALQKVASLINTVVSKLTNGKINVFEDVKDTKELVEFLNTISTSIREGKAITDADLKAIQESSGLNALGVSGEITAVDKAKSKSSITSTEIKRFPINENTKVEENIPLSNFEGKRVNLMESDRMVGGYIQDAEGNPLFKFYGGVYFPMITGKWWASRNEVKARSIAENANKNRDADGYIYSAPMVGSNTQHMSNTDMLAVTVELMKSDLNNKASVVKKQDIIDSLDKAFNREEVKNKKPALKNVLNKSNNITTLFNELEYVLFQENDNILDKNGKQILGTDKKPITKFTFEERKTIVQTLLGDPKVKQRRFPSAGSITETAKKFEEPITSKVENIGDMVTVMRTKGELKFAKTKIDDSFYHKSYPVEIYAVDKDGNPAEIEVFVLDGAYPMKDAVPTLSRSSGGEFTWEDYSSRHDTEMLAIAQYNRTAKLSYAAGNIQPVKSKSQVSSQYNMDEMFDNPDKMFEHLDNQLSDQKTAKQMGFVLKGYRNISEAIADNMITRSLAKAIGSGFIGITKIGNFSFVKINTKDKDGNIVPRTISLNDVWKDTIGYGENAIRSMFVKAHNSNNVAAKEVQNTLGSFITNLTTTERFQEARRELFGSKNNSNNLLTRIGESLNNMIGNDKRALYRVHSLLDPEAFANEPKEGRPNSVEDLSFSELRLFNTLRATNDFIHEWHYRNGFLDENTYQKNKGKYFARAYKEIEEKQYADIYDAINKAKAGAEFDIFKKRKEFSEIEDLTLSDPIYITVKRMGTMAHNKAIFDFAEKVANDANYKSYSKLSEVPEKNQKYYKKLNGNGNPKRFGDLTNKYVPIEIYEQLYGTQFATQYMSTINDFATKYDNMFLRQLTKKLKTVGSPLTRAANVISGFSFAMLGGVDPINLLIKKPDARRSLESYDSWAQELTKAGLLGGQLSGLDIKRAGKESQGLGVIKSVLGDKAAKAYETVDQLASDTYGKVDDITKIAYYRTLVENYGISKEEAIKATAKQMQNYNTVTNAFKLAAKLPLIGNAFIKFKPDSLRILYNTFKEKPIFGLMFVAMLTGLSKSFSKLSGESDEEREVRESRPNTTKFKIGNLVDVNFGWKIGGTEYNVARYLSPYTMYDRGYKNNLISDMSEYGPLQVQYLGRGRGLAGYAPKFSDPLLGPFVQAFFTDMDNSGLRISDPRANDFVGQTLSPKQQWFNRVKYVGRSWGTPYAAWAENMMDSFNEKQNYRGEIKDPLNAMLSIAIKNEKINPDILTEKYGRYLKSMDREVGDIVNDWKSKQKESLKQIDKIKYDFDNGKIKDIENRDKQIKDIENEYSDLAIDLQGQMLEIVGDAKDPQEMLIKLQKLKAKKK
jgi:hypothetical protein